MKQIGAEWKEPDTWGTNWTSWSRTKKFEAQEVILVNKLVSMQEEGIIIKGSQEGRPEGVRNGSRCSD